MQKKKDEDDDIEEEIVVEEKGSGDSDSIVESIPQASSSSRGTDSKKLGDVRKYLGSEESIRRSSKEVLSDKKKPQRSIF